ncbi:MAG: hypothetical protein ACYS76_13280, partial [Planctomycetota bacterium]
MRSEIPSMAKRQATRYAHTGKLARQKQAILLVCLIEVSGRLRNAGAAFGGEAGFHRKLQKSENSCNKIASFASLKERMFAQKSGKPAIFDEISEKTCNDVVKEADLTVPRRCHTN